MDGGKTVKRRRVCLVCNERWTTREAIEWWQR